jgi:hypothetical protein
VDFKIAPEDSLSIIGSNSINTAGDLYTINLNTITNADNRRNKRLLDLAVAGTALILSPFLLFFVKNFFGMLRNIFMVLIGVRSWVGYNRDELADLEKLPSIRKGILNPIDSFGSENISEEIGRQLNFIYARDYSVNFDIRTILKGFRSLGRKS